MSCCCGCSTNCDNTTDWNGRCCNWESFPPEMSQMFDGTVFNFGPTNVQVSPFVTRSEILNLPNVYITTLVCNLSSVSFPGNLNNLLSGTMTLGLAFSAFKLALARTNLNNDNCVQQYNMWFGLTQTINSVESVDIRLINPRNGATVAQTTNPLHVSLQSGGTIVGSALVRPCDGTNTTSNGGYGAGVFGLGQTEGLTTQDCDQELGLRFGWLVGGRAIRVDVPTALVNPGFGQVNIPTWVGCGIRDSLTSGFLRLIQDSTKLPMTVKRSTTWGQCPNLPISVNGQPNTGLQLDRGIQI